MKYPEPNQTFDALDHARNKVLRANQFQELVIQQFCGLYEDLWGLNPDGDSRYSAEEMQSVIDAMPQSTAIDMLQDAVKFVDFVNSSYPGVLDEKYWSAAWDYTIGPNGITITELKDIWKKKQNEEPNIT